MKKFIYTLSFIAIALTFAAASTFAQSATRIDADVPFDFAVGDEVLGAGKYVMRLRAAAGGAELLEIRNARNKVVFEILVMRNGETAVGKANLVFDRVAGHPVLAKIRLDNKGLTVRMEKSALTTLAAKDRKRAADKSN